MRSPRSTDAPYPFQAEKAFLDFATRGPDVRYRFDGRRIVCWESWHVRGLVLLAGAAVGPGLTILLLLGQLKGPWYVLAFAAAFSGIAWMGWIDALRHQYQVVFDLVGGNVQFLFHPMQAARYEMPLASVTGVEIATIQRRRGRSGNSMRALTAEELAHGVAAIACHNLVLVRDDGLRIHVIETPDRAVVEAIRKILVDGTSERHANLRNISGDPSDNT
jgi:hypothetical protein